MVEELTGPNNSSPSFRKTEEAKPGVLARLAAWEILQAVAAGAYAEKALDRVFKRNNFDDLDKGLIMELAYGSIKQRYLLDCWIDYLGKVTSDKQPPLLRWLLHLGLYQIFFLQKIPAAAAVNTCVEIAKKSKISTLAPVVNGVLRAALRAKEQGVQLAVPAIPEKALAQEFSLPIWLAKNLIDWRGERDAKKIAEAFNKSPTIDLRVNRLQTSPRELNALFDSAGIRSQIISGSPDGLQVLTGGRNLNNWPGYKEGYWCVQDRVAQLIAPLLDPQPGEKILDACAAPGGKTIHIVELIKNNGEVCAVDRSSKRIKLTRENAKRMRASCINFIVADACNLLEERSDWRESFQRILVDAPCSGLGTLARNPDARWRMTPEKIDELILLQFRIIENVLPLLSSRGRLVYSTCTINPSENVDQIRKFLSLHPSLRLIHEKQTWPDPAGAGDGFYAAVIDKY